ncbi:biotin--[acetyl-CoA-carboxylase] ligase [Microbacterium sp. 179-I 3D2 NHS]|uniref:biotin--[acetyl-CoA-carboxylase] ligase n=1 Tax=Microbacterium sp. 179-I 3D2 NHS TaxID=3235178 RepID=UPI0039A0CC78
MTAGFPRARAVASHLEVLPHTGSTNADLRERAVDAHGWPHLSVLLTRHQTAGRGRLDRRWIAPDGASLAVSVLLRTVPAGSDARGWIPLAAGLAMAEAAATQLPGHDVTVKWPNDVLVDGSKICGILAEATTDAVIVGSGVNTAMTRAELPVPTATSFAVLGAPVDDDRLVADYLSALDAWLARLTAADDAIASGLHAAVSARCGTLGRAVGVAMPGGSELRGTATAIDAQGRLVVTVDGSDHAVSAGDVVHVRPA